jgi:hypothetical protein
VSPNRGHAGSDSAGGVDSPVAPGIAERENLSSVAAPIGQSVRPMAATDFVPPDFAAPTEATFGELRLEPLGPEHNDADYAAWTSSIEHIRATPGFRDGSWPRPMPASENLRDLERHADDFRRRRGFTYTVLDADREVIGCVYIYPSKDEHVDATVQSWVCAARSDLDRLLYEAVRAWLDHDWPFDVVAYDERPPE